MIAESSAANPITPVKTITITRDDVLREASASKMLEAAQRVQDIASDPAAGDGDYSWGAALRAAEAAGGAE